MDALATLTIAAALLLYAVVPSLGLAAPAAALFLGAAYCRPRLALAAVLATLPTYFHARDLGGVAFALPEVALVLTAAAAAARALLRRDVRPRSTPFDGWIALLLLATLLSLLPTEYLKLSLRALRTLLLEPLLFYYLLVALSPDLRALRPLLLGFLGAAGAVALLAVGQVLLSANAVEVEGVRRALGPFPSPNHLGLYLGRALPFTVAGAVWASSGRGGYAALAMVMVLALGLSFSVGAWLGVGASLLVLAALVGRRALAATAVAGGTVAALALVALVRLGVERVVGQASFGGTTATSRRLIWSAAADMVRDHPLLGIGLDNFLYRYQLEYILPAAWAEPNMSHPHNWLLQFWLELGMLGLLAFLGLLGTCFWLAVRLARRGGAAVSGQASVASARSPLLAGALASLVGWLVHGSVDNSYFLLDQAYLFWWQVAVVAIAARSRSADCCAEAGARA